MAGRAVEAMSQGGGRLRRWVLRLALIGGGVFLALQLVPYGWSHTNPPVTDEAPWPSEAARDLAVAACYDCHSNETEWPVYSYVAPMSWLVRRDVDNGREALNFSTWGDTESDADDAADEIEEGEMPPSQYPPLHPDARLSDEERAVLIEALEAMDDGGEDHRGPGGGGEGDDDERNDNSGPGSDNSGPGSDNSGPGSNNSGPG
jgi:hypothetical protein